MKCIVLTAFSLLALHMSALASGNTDSAKAYYQIAKAELVAMLNGKQPANYERAIFLIENAYWENELDYTKYTELLDWNTRNIEFLRTANKHRFKETYSPSAFRAAMQNRDARQRALEKLNINWAIYSYMKDSVVPFVESNKKIRVVKVQPLEYSYDDPLGTENWDNTMVTHLLTTGKGNCYALASLYKIYADRLQADAVLSTAPSHIFIRHADENELMYNVELSNGLFPGSGTIETLTYTTNDATNNNIAMRDLDTRQAIALCLVYLAKGYEQKFGTNFDPFLSECAADALVFDDKSLSAMLLQMELLQKKILQKSEPLQKLQQDVDFIALEQLTAKLYHLGYREMPIDMKNRLIQGWKRDSSVILIGRNYNPPAVNHAGIPNTRYTSLSWGIFDEEIPQKDFEQYGSTLFNTKTKKIEGFTKAQSLYNDYNFDPVVFAWNVDPMAHKFPHASPYNFVEGNPISRIDPDGNEWVNAWDKQVERLGRSALERPNDKQLKKELQYAQSMQKDVNNVIKAIHDNDPALYDYIQNLNVNIFDKKFNVKVMVDIDYRVTGAQGQNGETNYILSSTQTGEYNGKEIRLPYASNAKKAPIGFSILLYGATPETLANEAGDVMYVMEYDKNAAENGSDAKKDWATYMKVGGAGEYSDKVETQYRKQSKAGSNSTEKGRNPYPLSN